MSIEEYKIRSNNMKTFYPYVNEKSHKLLDCWINYLKIEVKVSNPRKTNAFGTRKRPKISF